MRRTKTELFVHLVWATWDRLPLITAEIKPVVYASIQAQAGGVGAELLVVGGIEDHVHLIVEFPPTLSISNLVKQLKGSTSHLITHEVQPGETFKWQGSYGAFSLSKRSLPAARDYVLRQEEHHRNGTLLKALERTGDD
jgi:putative transposase